ncbi:MAG: serine/threonine-protein kinase [Xanthomonadales bacterium]|nr:serine/threonine-protein kinase [Xanthomonadales bacterium]
MNEPALDWARVTTLAEHALTLDQSSCNELLTGLGAAQAAEVERLLRRLPRGFMATSADGDHADPEQLEPGSLLGPWKVLEHIGHGGMGDIYRAVRADGVYEHTVALKLIQGLDEARTARFDEERRQLAVMNHPNIARIIDGGQSDQGLPFMAMEFVDGQPINQHVQSLQLSRTDVLRMFLSVCSAVAHAHSRLILHRDIKADNVLVSADGDPRLIDFGIATSLDEDGLRGGPLTLATAAPEQLKGEPLSVQTDVFSLGVLLHELVTGKRPERLPDGGMTVATAQVRNAELATILAKALAAEPEQRYASVEELHDELTALLEHRPIAARGGGRSYAAWKFLQRNPLASGFAAAAVLSLLVGLGASVKFAADARAETERAVAKQLEAEENLKRSQYFFQQSVIDQGIQRASSDLQQSLYGGEADVQRQTRIYMERWREAHARSDEEPDRASQIAYVVGRHFLFRNDYPTAIEVLSGWVEKGYGEEDLQLSGQHLLAIAYSQSGQTQEALPLLREVEAWRASTYEAGLADHIATASQIAQITRKPADIEKAENLLLNGIENHDGAYVIAYYLKQLAKFREMRGDFSGALEALRQEMDVVENELQLSVENSDTSRIGLARVELFFEGNLDRTLQLVNDVIDWSREVKGDSAVLGRAYFYKAVVLARQGELDRAIELMEAGVDLLIRFNGANSGTTLVAQMYLAEMLAENDAPRALALLADIRPAVETGNSRIAAQRYQLSTKLVGHITGEVSPAQPGTPTIDFELIRTNVELDSALRKLESQGLVKRPVQTIQADKSSP